MHTRLTTGRAVAFAIACATAACRSASHAPTPPTAVRLDAGTSAREVEALVDPSNESKPRGRLVTAWLTPDEAKAGLPKMTLATARRLFDRWEVGDEVDFDKTSRVRVRVPGAPPDASLLVVLDVERSFWPTMFGLPSGRGLRGLAAPSAKEVVISPNPPAPPSGEPCAGKRMKLVTVAAPSVAGTIGNPTTRRFCAWLPKSYEEKPARRYPVVFALAGFTGNEMSRFHGERHVGISADEVAAESGRDVIVVGVDQSTKLGSTYFEDSPVTGAFDTFFVKQGVAAIDAELRTIPRASARAIVGQSTGGYNAVSVVLRHSDVFTVVGASSPDQLDVEAWLFEKGTRRVKPWVVRWTRVEDALGGPGQMASYAADWSPEPADKSPSPKARNGYRWPFDLDTGAADEAVVARWVARTPAGLVRDPSKLARIRRDLSDRMMIIIGKNDEFDLFEPAKKFSEELRLLGVPHEFVATDHGHGDGDARLRVAMGYVAARLDQAVDPR